MLRMGISSLFYRLSDVTASVCAGEIRASPEAWEFKKTSWREQAVSATFPINQSSCFCKFRLCDCLSYSLALYFGFHQWKILHEVTHLRFLHNSLDNKKENKIFCHSFLYEDPSHWMWIRGRFFLTEKLGWAATILIPQGPSSLFTWETLISDHGCLFLCGELSK